MKRWGIGLAIVQLLLVGACDGGSGHKEVGAAEQVGIVEERGEVAGIERSSLTAEQKVADIEYLYHLMKENYPYIKVSERMTGLDWLSMQDYYEQRAATSEDDQAFLELLQKLLGNLGNGHTAMVQKEEYASMLGVFLKFQEEYGTHGPWVEQLSQPQTVQRYQGVPTASEAETKKSEESADAETSEKYRRAAELLGRQLRARSPLKLETLEDGRVAYLKIPGLQNERKEADLQQIIPFLEEQKEADALIFDIRGSGGGDSDYWF